MIVCSSLSSAICTYCTTPGIVSLPIFISMFNVPLVANQLSYLLVMLYSIQSFLLLCFSCHEFLSDIKILCLHCTTRLHNTSLSQKISQIWHCKCRTVSCVCDQFGQFSILMSVFIFVVAFWPGIHSEQFVTGRFQS